ncbi:SDR family oxidoreductase [Bifidobacterium amazonense]|uniref:SDR family oxidoreductase n=1 Tax=Bifidobacterium amazonense TaxID=2809027 RepID=A0ABS9VUD8_9BIFI|nr:SDR family oxidoreductase [Bifidobacterium amazonense]MCH9275554.1 SDR family oxidoreductase [Bifidobacterium amazonense]MCH9275571.1 SDR family oxidoreductase [Bifidobacterium amazonense]
METEAVMVDDAIFDQYPLDSWKDPGHRIMDRFSLAGKKGFVTGGAGGLGRNAAAAWAEAGADVAIVDLPRTRETLEPLAKEMSERYGTHVVPLYCDVSDRGQVAALKSSLVDELGTVDVAFINAGVNVPGDDADEPYEVWQRTLDINLTGAYLTAQAAQHIMREHKHGGSLIFTSSLSAHNANFIAGGPSPVAAYGATKAGIYEYARYLAAALAPYGIRSNAISPGYVWSGIFEGRITPDGHDLMTAPVPMRRFGTNEEIASAVLFLASDASSYVTGTNLQVDGGYSVY